MQWWSALTQQFTELAARAVKDGAELPGGLPGGGARRGPAAAPRGQAGQAARKATATTTPAAAAGKASRAAKAPASPQPRRRKA